MKKTLIALSLAAMGLATPAYATEPAPAESAETSAEALTVNVKGMVCDFCARAVTKVFGKNAAVDTVDVDLDEGHIHVGLKPGASLSDADIETMVKKSGYAMVSIDREVT